jgi:hypothetical protein
MNLQEQIDFLKNQLEKTAEWLSVLVVKQGQEFTKPKSKRFLVDGVNCFFLSPCGSLFDDEDSSSLAENDNAFIDKESAQLQAQRNTLVYRMRVAAAECPVDWSNQEDKYFLSLDCYDNEINIAYSKIVRRSQLPHFASKFKLEIFINSLSTDEQKLLICGVE